MFAEKEKEARKELKDRRVNRAEFYRKYPHAKEGRDRDYGDAWNPDLAVYNFRGYTVVELNKKTKKVRFGRNAHECLLIEQDLLFLREFLAECHKYINGEMDDVENILV